MIEEEPFVPLELFRPSGLSKARLGSRIWAFTYILNLREPQPLWADIKDIPKPVAKIKSKPTDEEKKAIKAYNKRRRPALGTEVHARLEQYMSGAGDVDWSDEPGRIALSGLPHLPSPSKCLLVECEQKVTLDLTFLAGVYPWANAEFYADPIVFSGTRDLMCQLADGSYLLLDHKTTYTFDWIDRDKTIKTVKTPEQLIADEQVNVYGLSIMQKYGLTELPCRWVYYRTEGDPAAKQVDFTITRAGAESYVANLVVLALELRALMRTTPQTLAAINGIECNVLSCGKFVGCVYHPDQGGPCTPPVLTMGERLVQLRKKKTTALSAKKESNRMALSFREKALAKEAELAGKVADTTELPPPPVEDADPNAELEPSDTQEEITEAVGRMAKDVVTPDDEKTETAAQTATRKARGPNKVKAPAATGSLGATIAELSTSLIANEQEHAAIVARMREVLS